MWIIKIIKIKCFYPPRMNTDASILVYKFRPERTGFYMYAEYTKLQLTFLTLQPCFYPPRILDEHWCIYSCLQISPRENWFQYVRRVHKTAINFPCIKSSWHMSSYILPENEWINHIIQGVPHQIGSLLALNYDFRH